MLFSDIAIIDEDFTYCPHKWVGVRDGRIDYIGDEAPASADGAACGAYGEVVDGAGKLVMPALYNAHAHAPMTLLRGYAENLPLEAWLNDTVWPFEAKMSAQDNYWATLLACAEMARFGCVSFSDMYYHTPERARAVSEAGMKANLSTSPLAFEPKDISAYPLFQEMVDARASLHGAFDGRILIDACVHAEYTNNDVTCKSVVEWARANGVRMHIHLSETSSEVQACRERHGGLSPVAWFDSLGAFDVPTTAAHCVWVDDADIQLLADKGVFAAINPASNMKLASGFAPVPALLDAGVAVCLGTDGMASNNNHDLFQDMYLMGVIYKGHEADPAVISPAQVLRAATRTGALAQGRKDCGLVKVGFKADLAVLDVSGPSWWPVHDMLTNVVYAGHGSDVVMTLCDGRVVYRDGVWPGIDVERARAEVSDRAERIKAAVQEES